jgi:hypothetical protein
VRLALVCWPREYALGLSRLVRPRPWAAEACAAVPWSVSGLLPGLRWAIALTLPSLLERMLFGLAGMCRRCMAVSEWVGKLLMRMFLAADRGTGMLRRAWGVETELQMGMTVKRAEIAEMGSDCVGLVGSMYMLVLAMAKCRTGSELMLQVVGEVAGVGCGHAMPCGPLPGPWDPPPD